MPGPVPHLRRQRQKLRNIAVDLRPSKPTATMKIYTRTGDHGSTSLVGGTRVPKSYLRIEAYGTVDELNSYLGLLRDQEVNAPRRELLKEIQDRLFTIGANLASEPDQTRRPLPDLYEADVERLEQAMDQMDLSLAPLRHFVLPGGHPSVSFGHVARTVCRRAERVAVALAAEPNEYVADLVVKYLNRLSDYLFVLCRAMAHDLGVEEVKWHPRVS
jgi:cob(I)alamin adenosyltransferase